MGIENCCLRPEEKKEEITHSNQINEVKSNEFPQDSVQINNLEEDNQLQTRKINQNLNDKGELSNQGLDQQKQNEENEEQAEEQMEEQADELGEGEEEGQVVEVHEEIEIEDVIPGQEDVKIEEQINPIDQLGETVVQTTYLNNPNNINTNNYTQQELNDIFQETNLSKPANSYIDYNNQNIGFVNTASAEGAFDLNNMQIQSNVLNDINMQNLDYGLSSSAAVPINNENINALLKNDNNANAALDLNNLREENTGNLDLNNFNIDSLNNNVDNQQYNFEIGSNSNNYNNDLNSLVIQDSNSSPEVNYSISANPLVSNLTFGVQNEGINYENLENIQGQSANYNYS